MICHYNIHNCLAESTAVDAALDLGPGLDVGLGSGLDVGMMFGGGN